MRNILTVGVRSRFNLREICDMWGEFNRQRADRPNEILFEVGTHTDPREFREQKVWVKIDLYPYPDEKVATMLLSDEC